MARQTDQIVGRNTPDGITQPTGRDVDDAGDHEHSFIGGEVLSPDCPSIAAIWTRGTFPLDLHEPGLPDAIPGIDAVDPPAVNHWQVGLQPAPAAQKKGAVQVLFGEPTDLTPG
jgi:hypothetical protein